MRIHPGEVVDGIRFLSQVPGFFRRVISPEVARSVLHERLAHREADFLHIARHLIFSSPVHPVRRLLENAGCTIADLEALVVHEGLEGALSTLSSAGVHLTCDEMRGNVPIVRGSTRFFTSPSELRNPAAQHLVSFHGGGSRGSGTIMPLDLAHTWDRGINACLVLAARGGQDWVHGLWKVPGSSGLNDLLENGVIRARTVRWFSQIDPAGDDIHPRYRWSARALRLGGLLSGVSLPGPEYVPLDEPQPIATWMAGTVQAGAVPHLRTYASAAVRVCEAAPGGSLAGAIFLISGEPVTEVRLAAIRSVGAEASVSYGSSESGNIGKGCLGPKQADDLHFFSDLHALIQPGPNHGTSLPEKALLLTTLRPSSRFILLNASMGDQANVEQRACGCPLDRYQWSTHLSEIRSFEKLTAGGMTLMDSEVVHVLETVLPARFGGGPTDYQLLDGERADGTPDLTLLIHPRVGPLPADEVRSTFLQALALNDDRAHLMAQLWGQGRFVSVLREPPRSTSAGKLQHITHLGTRER